MKISASIRTAIVTAGTLLLAAALLSACNTSVNKAVNIAEGERVEGGRSTVNGAIRVGANAEVGGKLSTVNGSATIGAGSRIAQVSSVNGSIDLAAGASARDLDTVNGRISLQRDVVVTGSVETVNGGVTLAPGSRVEGAISAVNGQIRLEGAEAASVSNFNGGMEVTAGSRVHGELHVKRPRGTRERIPRIVIGPDSTVVGPLIFDREVELHVHASAEIGEIQGVEPQLTRFDD